MWVFCYFWKRKGKIKERLQKLFWQHQLRILMMCKRAICIFCFSAFLIIHCTYSGGFTERSEEHVLFMKFQSSLSTGKCQMGCIIAWAKGWGVVAAPAMRHIAEMMSPHQEGCIYDQNIFLVQVLKLIWRRTHHCLVWKVPQTNLDIHIRRNMMDTVHVH